MNITVGKQEKVDVVIHILFTDGYQVESLSDWKLSERMGKEGQVRWIYGRQDEPDHLLLGLGKKADFTLDRLRAAAGTAGRAVREEQLQHVGVSFASLENGIGESLEELVTAWVEGWKLGTYTFTKFQSKEAGPQITSMNLQCQEKDSLQAAIQRGLDRAEGTMFARDLCNEPSNHLRPTMLVERIRDQFAKRKVNLKVYTGEELEKHQMNGLLTVGKGSNVPPAMIELSYCTDPKKPLIVLIGKGITFDTGGINLKLSRDISDMRFDLGGAAAVIGAMDILTRMEAEANVTALIPTAENMPDGGAMRPGDIIEYPNGVTVQVGNTDAEGRLILADALIHAQTLGAKEVIDAATLTGAIVRALGLRLAGVWGDESMVKTLKELGEKNGEKLWPMPLVEEYEELIKSDYADISNLGKADYAGAITAALFLRHFVNDYKWAHIDLAAPVESNQTKGYLVKGATGYGARLLADYVLSRV